HWRRGMMLMTSNSLGERPDQSLLPRAPLTSLYYAARSIASSQPWLPRRASRTSIPGALSTIVDRHRDGTKRSAREDPLHKKVRCKAGERLETEADSNFGPTWQLLLFALARR